MMEMWKRIIPLKEIKEGKCRLMVPMEQKTPSKATVFYNPIMALNRDISILIARYSFNNSYSVIDPFTGTGVRGIRYFLEGGNIDFLVLSDINPMAVKLANLNLKLNNVNSALLIRGNIHNVLNEVGSKFDLIDIDPFGSPAPYFEASVLFLERRGVLCATATDMPPLVGIKAYACIRKYGCKPIRTIFPYELAVRIVLGSLCIAASRHERSVEPLFSLGVDHYVRIWIRLNRGKEKIKKALREIGYLCYCNSCFNWIYSKDWTVPDVKCEKCGGKMKVSGPLWLGKLWNEKICRKIDENSLEDLAMPKRVEKLVDIILMEMNGPPFYYDIPKICDKLNVRSPPLRLILNELKERGYFASRTHFDLNAVRTNADISELESLIHDASC